MRPASVEPVAHGDHAALALALAQQAHRARDRLAAEVVRRLLERGGPALILNQIAELMVAVLLAGTIALVRSERRWGRGGARVREAEAPPARMEFHAVCVATPPLARAPEAAATRARSRSRVASGGSR